MSWKFPSGPVRELIRQCAQVVVSARPEWLDELDEAVLAANPVIAADPELAAAVSRNNQANLFFWGTANVRDPGRPYPQQRSRAVDHRPRTGAPGTRQVRPRRLPVGKAWRGGA